MKNENTYTIISLDEVDSTNEYAKKVQEKQCFPFYEKADLHVSNALDVISSNNYEKAKEILTVLKK